MSRVRLVVSDPLAEEGLEVLRRGGIFEVVTVNGSDSGALKAALASAEALLVRSGTRVTGGLIDSAPRLKLVGRAGTGVDNIDVAAATRKGVVVMNTPDANSIAAAEHTMALILALVRNVVPASRSMASGLWDRASFMGTELAGKTLGLVGFGRIGREVARRARSFGMAVLTFDPFISEDVARQGEAEASSLESLLSRSDLVSLHAPLTKATRHMIGRRELALMKPGARVINCARGGLIDESALLEALEGRRLAGAALDVFETEPPSGSPLLNRADVVTTPHLGASTREAQQSVAYEIAVQVRDYFTTGAVRNAVNMPALSAEARQQAAPYVDLAERLGILAGSLSAGAIRKIAFEYLGETADLPLAALTIAGLKGCLSTRAGESVNYVNARVMATELSIEVSESFHPTAEDFANLTRVSLETEEGTERLAGSVIRRRDPRLVELNGYELDAIPAGPVIVLENDDVPGVVGAIGTLLGDQGINIGRINWGRAATGGTALTVINVDSPPPPDLLRTMSANPRVRWVKAALLPA